jgi:Fur family iron response transcriptional regulator
VIPDNVYEMLQSSPSREPSGAQSQSQSSRAVLEQFGLRATRQRSGLAKLLFEKGNRHVTADRLAAEAKAAKVYASLATVYNILNLFAQVGLVRGLAIEGAKTIFDTNTKDHGHFYFEETGEIEDIALDGKQWVAAVDPPEGYEIVRVDVVVRLRQRGSSTVT